MTPFQSLGEASGALFPFWAAQLPSADGEFQVQWAAAQTEVSSTFKRLADVGELLYARRDQLVPEGRLLGWQLAQFMSIGPGSGAFGFGDGRGEGIMVAMARDYEADAFIPDDGDPDVASRWAPPPPPPGDVPGMPGTP